MLYGINTHLDFTWTAYSNIQTVINCLKYLGVQHVRDSANSSNSVNLWQQVAKATGVKFNAYIGEGSQQLAVDGLARLPSFIGLLESIEGINEADDPYSISQGNNLAFAATFQQQVYAMAKNLVLPAINISFGAGWNKPTGDYGTVGDLTAYCDYANAHTYPGPLSDPAVTVDQVNRWTQFAAKRPVMTTELGWYTGTMSGSVTEQQQADKLIAALAECTKTNAGVYAYELLDQKTGDANPENNFGLFHSDGTPKAAANAYRDFLKNITPAVDTPIIQPNGVIIDPWAASHAGAMTLNLGVSGTLAQLNNVMKACSGLKISAQVFNQAGKAATMTGIIS